MAKSLFGGPKGPVSKPAPSKAPEPKKEAKKEKVETVDLI